MSRRIEPSPFRIALLATLAMMLAYLAASQSAPLRRLEGQLLDVRFQLRPEPPVPAPIALVMIDDASIAALGRWPWSRARLAELLDLLGGAGARVVAFDLLFAEPELTEQSGPWLRDLDAALRALGQPEDPSGRRRLNDVLARRAAGSGGDLALARAMRRAGDVVVPFSFEFDGAPATAPEPPPDDVARAAYRAYRHAGPGEPSVALTATSILPPIPSIARAAGGLGHVNIARDRDGTARFEYPVVAYAGAYYPSFPIEVARAYLGVEPAAVLVEFGRGIQLGAERFVPTDEGMRLLVGYRRPGRYRVFSFADVLAGAVPPDAFRDAIVLVGGSAAGLGESFVTPFSPALPGTARHAAVVDGVLAGDFLVRRDATALADLTLMAAAGLLLGAAAAWTGTLATSLALAALLLAVAAGNLLAFTRLGLWLNLLFPVLTLVAVYAAVMLHRYVVGQRQQRQIRRAFEHYVHPAVVAEVSRNPQLLKLGGEERELSVLFADIRNYTPMAERLPPPDLVRLMNAFYTAMTEVVVGCRGMLDQYVGDGLVAVFGAPLPLEDHALRACEAALAMHRALRGLNRELARDGLPELRIGIGINTGPMILGNLGSERRFDYPILGDGVNLAARLESATKDYGVGVLVSGATWRGAAGRVAGRELDVIRVKGKERPVRVFELLGLPPLPEPRRRLVEDFAAALAEYRGGRWREALAAFERVLDHAPDDGPSRLYARRCRERLAERMAG
ncbi:MAG TPA: adenylate/guanylate cyclase domain-containing protein [Geminicoccaceae bacterium]|nr:adenylate/guanylate cyclase domain-containing protein [Geminicoccaceae bacterium]